MKTNGNSCAFRVFLAIFIHKAFCGWSPDDLSCEAATQCTTLQKVSCTWLVTLPSSAKPFLRLWEGSIRWITFLFDTILWSRAGLFPTWSSEASNILILQVFYLVQACCTMTNRGIMSCLGCHISMMQCYVLSVKEKRTSHLLGRDQHSKWEFRWTSRAFPPC